MTKYKWTESHFLYFTRNTFYYYASNVATFDILRHPVIILVTDFTIPDNLINDIRTKL